MSVSFYQRSRASFLLMSFAVFAIMSLNSCASKRKVAESGKLKKRSSNYLVKKLSLNEQAPETFKAKARVKVKSRDFNQNFNADIRMKKDSIIWMSVYPAIGIKIEVGRAIITRDSIKVLDRFKKQYYAKGVDFVQNYVNYPLDFETLQNLILGNPLFEVDDNVKANINKNNYSLRSKEKDLEIELELDPSNFAVTRSTIKDPQYSRNLIVDMSNFEKIDKKPFALIRNVEVKAEDYYKAELKFSKIKTNDDLSYPFSVGSKYERVDD